MIEGTHFQNAYITRDVAKAVAQFKQRADLRHEGGFEGPTAITTPSGAGVMVCKIAFLWVGDLQYEFIEPISGMIDLYNDALPADDRLVFHHVATRVSDWDDFRARVDRQTFPIVLEGEAGPARFLYLDARPWLGHYLEYLYMPEDMWLGTGGR